MLHIIKDVKVLISFIQAKNMIWMWSIATCRGTIQFYFTVMKQCLLYYLPYLPGVNKVTEVVSSCLSVWTSALSRQNRVHLQLWCFFIKFQSNSHIPLLSVQNWVPQLESFVPKVRNLGWSLISLGGHVKNNEGSHKGKCKKMAPKCDIVVKKLISSCHLKLMYWDPRKMGNLRILKILFFDHFVTHLLHYF